MTNPGTPAVGQPKWRWRVGCLAVVGVLVCGAWSLWHGWWKAHARAESPDGRHTAESRNFYIWAPLYGWNHFYIRVLPPTRIRGKEPKNRWRGTPSTIKEWNYEHHYATYNDFDDRRRFPEAVRWISTTEFVIDGGEGDGLQFELER